MEHFSIEQLIDWLKGFKQELVSLREGIEEVKNRVKEIENDRL